MPDAWHSRFEPQAALTGGVGRPLGFLARPTIGAVGWSGLRRPRQLLDLVLVRPDIGQWVASEWR